MVSPIKLPQNGILVFRKPFEELFVSEVAIFLTEYWHSNI
jgi:hypothetical protein